MLTTGAQTVAQEQVVVAASYTMKARRRMWAMIHVHVCVCVCDEHCEHEYIGYIIDCVLCTYIKQVSGTD